MSSYMPHKRHISFRGYDGKQSKYSENDSSMVEHAITNLGEESDSVIKDLERFVDSLDHEILYHKHTIFNLIYKLSCKRPEMISTYVTLAGMLHVHESEFGSDFLFYITDKINYHFQTNDYYEIKYLFRLVCDLVNVNMISVKCILDLFDKMIVTARDESTSLLYSNWLLYTIITSLPWMASKADSSSEFGQQFDNFLQELSVFYEQYNGTLYKAFRIWSMTSSEFLQIDYIVSAWENMKKLKCDDWKWTGVTRPYDSVRELKKAVRLTLPNIMFPSSSEMYNLPIPQVVTQIFVQDDIDDDALGGFTLPSAGCQIRIQIEEQIQSILRNYSYDRKECIARLVSLSKFTKYAVPYIIIEYLFICALSLPCAPFPDSYCCIILCLLCRASKDIYPIIVNKIVNILVKSCDAMNNVCLYKFACLFSHYIANNLGNWNWDEFEFILELNVSDNKKIFLLEILRKLQIHYDDKFKMDEQFAVFNHLLESDKESNYYYGLKSSCSQELLEIKKKFVAKIVAKSSCDDLYHTLDSLLSGYNDEVPFLIGNMSKKTIIQVHLTMQTLLAAHRHILSKTFGIIELHEPLLKRLITCPEHELIALYSVYQFWYRNPIRIKVIFFYLWRNNIIEPTSIIKLLLHNDLKSNLNKFYIWEIIEELLDSYAIKDLIFHQNCAKNNGKPSNNKKFSSHPKIKMDNSGDDMSSEPLSDSDGSYADDRNAESFSDERSDNLSEFKALLCVLFENLGSIIFDYGMLSDYEKNIQSKTYFFISQFFQHFIMKYIHWFKLVIDDINEISTTKNFLQNENLATILSRFNTSIS